MRPKAEPPCLAERNRALHDGLSEITTGDGFRLAARDIVEIGVEPPRAGRLSVRLSYRAGLDGARTSDWVEPEHETALQRLVDAVTALKGEA